MKKVGIDIKPTTQSTHVMNDYLLCAKGNGVQVPHGVTETDMKDFESTAVRNWWSIYLDPLMAHLAIGM